MLLHAERPRPPYQIEIVVRTIAMNRLQQMIEPRLDRTALMALCRQQLRGRFRQHSFRLGETRHSLIHHRLRHLQRGLQINPGYSLWREFLGQNRSNVRVRCTSLWRGRLCACHRTL